jgi:hypothetical protein
MGPSAVNWRVFAEGDVFPRFGGERRFYRLVD